MKRLAKIVGGAWLVFGGAWSGVSGATHAAGAEPAAAAAQGEAKLNPQPKPQPPSSADEATENKERGPDASLAKPKGRPASAKPLPPKPTAHEARNVEGWNVRVDRRLLEAPDAELGERALRTLAAKLADVERVVRPDRLAKLKTVTIVLDLSHGGLSSMQYHPSKGWLEANGYAADLAKCVHLPRAVDLLSKRSAVEQPWVMLHELSHAFHDQALTFEEPRIVAAYEKYKASGRGEGVMLYDGRKVKHYALTDHKEFFAEMSESYLGSNDFYPFNRAELKESEPEIHALLKDVWETPLPKTP